MDELVEVSRAQYAWRTRRELLAPGLPLATDPLALALRGRRCGCAT